MTAVNNQATVADYLALERSSDVKHEFIAGQIVAMAGASFAHSIIAHNVSRSLGNALEESPCRVCPSDMRIRTRSTLYTYPDVAVVCAKPQFDGDRQDILLNPILIVEVLSTSTKAYDRGQKFEHYQSIASLQTYILISQDRIHVDRFEKQPDGEWKLKSFNSVDGLLALPTLNITLSISDFYKKVEFPPPV